MLMYGRKETHLKCGLVALQLGDVQVLDEICTSHPHESLARVLNSAVLLSRPQQGD